MDRAQRQMVKFYQSLPMAKDLLNPQEDFHWSRIFEWDRGETFRIATPIHAATYGEKWAQDFAKVYGPALVMPLTLMTKGLGFGARAIKQKKFSAHFFEDPGFYSASTCFQEGFRYGEPILIVEGVLDAEVASLTYPWTIAALTASVSEQQAFLLSHMTNTVVLSLDADEAGEKGAFYSKKHLQKWGVRTMEMKPSGVGDWGDLLSKPRDEMQMELNRYTVELRSKGVLRD